MQAKKKNKIQANTKNASRKKIFSSPVLIVAGEHSGDLLGGDLIEALKKKGITSFFGTGGESMKSAGAELVENIENMNVMGFVDALFAYRRLKKLALNLAEDASGRNTKLAILIDYPGFNLRLAEMLKEKGIRVVYLVSPQIWAWKYGRIKSIRKNVDLMLVLFHFEKEIYDRENVPCEWIGHPMIKRIPFQLKKENKESGSLKKFKGISVGLLPGSRRSEIFRHTKVLLESAEKIAKEHSNIRFLIPCADVRFMEYLKNEASVFMDLNIDIIEGRSLSVMEESDLLILSSGTATLEGAFFGKPMIVIYRASWINFLLATLLLRTRFISLVNIIARKQVLMELLQDEAVPENIYKEAEEILKGRVYKKNMISELESVSRSLGRGSPAQKAADTILRHF